MITIDQLKMVKEVLFHESCPDGTAAAMICRAALGPDVEFYSIQYGTDFMSRLEPRSGQLFVDITPPIPRWEEWKAYSPIILDHHETAKQVTEGLGGIYGLNETHSGAMLAYDHVLSAIAGSGNGEIQDLARWRDLAELAMIRDTWKQDHPRWREACAQAMALQFHGSKKLIEIVGSGDFQFNELSGLGLSLLEQAERKTKLVARGAYLKPIQTKIGELKTAYFNCTEKIISDVAHTLLNEGADVAIGYFHLFEDGAMKISVSIRTNEKIAANVIAKYYGGGGHERAAGFHLSVDEAPGPDQLSEKIIEAVNS
jgi:hypothetical protein